MDQGLRPAGLRLFQSQHSREEGRWVRNLPRTRRRDALDVSESLSADAVVSRLPPQSGTIPSPPGPDNEDGIRTVRAASGTGRTARQGIPRSEIGDLLDLPQISDR